jgi:hypothetical protein
LAHFGPLQQMDASVKLQFIDVHRVGDDLRLIARPHGVDIKESSPQAA